MLIICAKRQALRKEVKTHRKPSFRWWGHSPAPQLGVLGWRAPQTRLMVLTLFSLGLCLKGPLQVVSGPNPLLPPAGPAHLLLFCRLFTLDFILVLYLCFLSLFLSIRMQTWPLPYSMTPSYKPVLPTQNSSPDTWEPRAWAPQSEFCVHSRVSS